MVDTSGGAVEITLPAGSLNAYIELKDAVGSWDVNNLTITPAAGEKINGLAVDESLVGDVRQGWISLAWDVTNSRWNISTTAAISLPDIVASASEPGIVSIENQSFAGIKTFTDGIILEPNTTPVVNPTSGLQVYAKADNKLYTLTSGGLEQAVGSGGSIILVSQVAHGFVAADVGRPLYLNGSTYELAKADTEATAEVAGLISRVIDVDSFEICLGGEVSSVGASLVEGGGSLTTGEVYFLSATTAGTITTTAPTVVGQIAKPVGIARTTTALDFFNMRGNAVGGSNVYTQIGLANNATTTIQNASAYDSVELAGWVYINATTDLRFHFKAQVTKKGDGTDYLVSFQTSGDTPPSGFDIDATSGGLVQVVMPSVAGFTSAIAQFSLNGPAVGASLPLQIESNLINYSQSPSYRNKIINGDMRIAQRGTSKLNQGGSSYLVDRFWVNPSGGNISFSQESAAGEVGLPSEFSYYQKLITNTGDNYSGIVQKVEDVRTFAGQTVTFSFWAKGTNPGGGQFSVRLNQGFDSSTTDVDVRQFMVITSSWKKYSFTFNLASIPAGAVIGNNSSIWVIIEQPGDDASTAAWTLDTTGWQLEAGSVATPFEHRPFGLELQLCQRYYEKSYGPSVLPGTSTYYAGRQTAIGPTPAGEPLCGFSFSVIKRAKPTIVIYNPTTGAANQVRRYNGSVATSINVSAVNDSTNVNEKGVTYIAPSSGSYTTGYTYDWHWTADAEL